MGQVRKISTVKRVRTIPITITSYPPMMRLAVQKTGFEQQWGYRDLCLRMLKAGMLDVSAQTGFRVYLLTALDTFGVTLRVYRANWMELNAAERQTEVQLLLLSCVPMVTEEVTTVHINPLFNPDQPEDEINCRTLTTTTKHNDNVSDALHLYAMRGGSVAAVAMVVALLWSAEVVDHIYKTFQWACDLLTEMEKATLEKEVKETSQKTAIRRE